MLLLKKFNISFDDEIRVGFMIDDKIGKTRPILNVSNNAPINIKNIK